MSFQVMALRTWAPLPSQAMAGILLVHVGVPLLLVACLHKTAGAPPSAADVRGPTLQPSDQQLPPLLTPGGLAQA